MTDVFISYKREERALAQRLAEAFGGHGFSVWWDAELLPGERYRAVTLEILQSCRAAVVIWSPLSVASNWVLDEAQRALDRGVLVPVMMERTAIPLGFGQLHTHDLIGWDGDAAAAALQPVMVSLRRLVGRPEAAPAPKTTAEAEAEVAFWRGVHDSREAADFETYLARYPDGLFADLARRRVDALAQPAPRKRAASARKPKRAKEAADALPHPQPAAALASASPPFTPWELGFVAAIALIAPFPAWPLANRLLGAAETFYGGDIAMLVSGFSFYNIYLVAPLLIAFAWAADRGLAWWAAQGRPSRIPRIAMLVLLALALVVSLSLRDNYGAETHFVLWLGAIWAATIYARPATRWLAARAPAWLRRLKRRP